MLLKRGKQSLGCILRSFVSAPKPGRRMPLLRCALALINVQKGRCGSIDFESVDESLPPDRRRDDGLINRSYIIIIPNSKKSSQGNLTVSHKVHNIPSETRLLVFTVLSFVYCFDMSRKYIYVNWCLLDAKQPSCLSVKRFAERPRTLEPGVEWGEMWGFLWGLVGLGWAWEMKRLPPPCLASPLEIP